VEFKRWRESFYQMQGKEKKQIPRIYFNRAKKGLEDRGIVTVCGEYCWFTEGNHIIKQP
jgi:hypothetical protein